MGRAVSRGLARARGIKDSTRANAPRPPARRPRVLIIDDDAAARQSLVQRIEALGYEAVTGDAAPVQADTLDLCLFDVSVVDGHRLATMHRLAEAAVTVVAMTATPSVAVAVQVMRQGTADYLAKPLSDAAIVAYLGRIASPEPNPAPLDVAALANTRYTAVQAAAELVRRAAASEATVLIRGETGVGKRALAQAIHRASHRASGPFVVAPCRAASARHLANDWFGRSRGDGDADARGRIASAAGGTLTLDEIVGLPESLDTAVCRLARDRLLARPGDDPARPLDVRVMATTAAGQNVSPVVASTVGQIVIDIPPLRQRPDDIPQLAGECLRGLRRPGQAGPRSFAPAALDALRHHSWPGNLRELQTLIGRAAAVARGPRIEAADLTDAGPLNAFAAVVIGDPVPLAKVEELHIRAVLAASPSLEAAAERLGVDPATLWRRRKRFAETPA